MKPGIVHPGCGSSSGWLSVTTKEMRVAELELSEAIEALRVELAGAINAGANEWMRFGLAPIELTLQAVVTKGVDGKIGWKILAFGGKHESAVTQTVKLTLTPTWRTSDGRQTTDFTIASDVPTNAKIGPKPPTDD
jgi:hypothetical protein